MRNGAVFIDRDGVINQLVPDPVSGRPESPLAMADVALIEGAAAALKRLSNAGWRLVGVSNQPAAAKGLTTLAELERVQGRVLALLEAEGVRFADFRLCFHHPDGVVPGLAVACDCRKPGAGMLLAAARAMALDTAESWMIGDTDADVVAGQSAGCRTILVHNAGSAHKRLKAVAPDGDADDLAMAVDLVLRGEE